MIKSLGGLRLIPFEPEFHTLTAAQWQNSGDYLEFFRAEPVPATLRGIAGALDGRTFMIVLPDNTTVGAIMHFKQDEVARNFEVAVLIDKGHEGQKIAFNALKMFLNWKFNTCNLYRAEFMVLERNRRLCQALDTFGARFEGLLRKKAFIDGEFQNVAAYAVFKTDFNKMYQEEFKMTGPRLDAPILKDQGNGQAEIEAIPTIPRAAVRGARSAS